MTHRTRRLAALGLGLALVAAACRDGGDDRADRAVVTTTTDQATSTTGAAPGTGGVDPATTTTADGAASPEFRWPGGEPGDRAETRHPVVTVWDEGRPHATTIDAADRTVVRAWAGGGDAVVFEYADGGVLRTPPLPEGEAPFPAPGEGRVHDVAVLDTDLVVLYTDADGAWARETTGGEARRLDDDPDSGVVVAVVAGGGRVAFVTEGEAGRWLTWVDGRGRPLTGIENPFPFDAPGDFADVAVTPDGTRVLVVDGDEVVAFDLDAGDEAGRWPLPVDAAPGSRPGLLDTDGRWVAVSLLDDDHPVAFVVVDTTTGETAEVPFALSVTFSP